MYFLEILIDGLFILGVEHTDDLYYIFYRDGTAPMFNSTDPEHKMVERMTRIWEHFALTG